MGDLFGKFDDIHLITLALGVFLIIMFIYHSIFNKKKSPEEYAFEAMEKQRKEEVEKSKRINLSSVYSNQEENAGAAPQPVAQPVVAPQEEAPRPTAAALRNSAFRQVNVPGQVKREEDDAKKVSNDIYEWE